MASEALNASYRALFNDMLKAWRAAPPPASIQVEEMSLATAASVDATVVIHGWVARVFQTGRAVLVLHDVGYIAEAAPLVRSMIEHAIAVVWLEDKRGDALQALIRKRGETARRLEQAQKLGWDLSPEAQEFLRQIMALKTDEGTISQDYLNRTTHQATSYGLGSLYQAWLIESDSSHPSISSSVAYFDVESGAEEQTVELRYEARETGAELPGSVTLIAYVALQIYNSLLVGNPLEDELARWRQMLDDLNLLLEEERQARG